MNEAPTIQAIFEGAPAPVVHKPTAWEWITYYVWNLYRKPLVIAKQKELRKIALAIQGALAIELLPELWNVRLECRSCREFHAILKSQTFVSVIEKILRSQPCEEHPLPYARFLVDHRCEFNDSENIAAWINGFKR